MSVEVQTLVWSVIGGMGVASLVAIWKLATMLAGLKGAMAAIVTELKATVNLLRAERKEAIREVVREEIEEHVKGFHH